MLVLILLSVTLLVLLVRDVVRKRSGRWTQLCKFPGDRPLPLIGNALALGFDSDVASAKLLEMWRRHGKISFRVSVGSEDWVLLTDPDDVGVLYSDSTILSKSPERNAAVKPFFGDSVSTSEGDRWRWARKLVLSGFHVKSIGQRLDVINALSDQLVHRLSQYQDKDVPVYKYLRPYMLDVLFKTLMGVESNFLEDLDHQYLTESGKIVNMITENYFSYWRNIRPIFELTPMYKEMKKTIKCIRQTATNVIAQRKYKLQKIRNEIITNRTSPINDLEEEFKTKISEENTLLDLFLLKNLPNGENVPEDVINDEISFVLFTGHFTTSVTISHVLYCLAKYPEVQKRVIEEQRSIFYDNFNRKQTVNDVNQMTYLEAVVKETFRVIPTVPKIGRKLAKDLILKDGRVIPAGTTAIVYYEAMFVNEKVFPEPDKFNPDRFINSNMHPHAFLPFGGGPRSCIGLRFAWTALKASLSNILRRFEVFEGSPGSEPQFSYRIVTESKNGVTLKLRKR